MIGNTRNHSFDIVFIFVATNSLIDSLTANPLYVPTADCFEIDIKQRETFLK